MKKALVVIALLVVSTIFLSGCSSRSTPKVIIYPTYAEQDAATEPRYDLNSGSNESPTLYTSESIVPSTKINNNIVNQESISRDLEKSIVFDIKPPVENQPFIIKITFKSDKAGYFVGVSRDGSYTESIAYFDREGTVYTISGVYGNRGISGIKVFGNGQWEMETSPVSQLPVFDKKIKGKGAQAFIVDGETKNVLVTYDNGTDISMRSYGYDNRMIFLSSGSGSKSGNTALPGKGAIVLIDYDGDWKIQEVKKVDPDEKK